MLADVEARRKTRIPRYYTRLLNVAFRILKTDGAADPLLRSGNAPPVAALPFIVEQYIDRAPDAKEYRSGVRIAAAMSGAAYSGAEPAAGDMLVSVNRQPVTSIADYEKSIKKMAGDRVVVKFLRDGVEYESELEVSHLVRSINFHVGGTASGFSASTDGRNNIFVTPALLNYVKNDDELAFVLSHEISHIELGHYQRQILTSIAAQVPAVVVASLFNEGYEDVGSAAGQLTYFGVRAPFSQDAELAADQRAMEYMRRGGYDPAAGARFMKRMAVEVSGSDERGWFSTHPAPQERMRRLSEYHP